MFLIFSLTSCHTESSSYLYTSDTEFAPLLSRSIMESVPTDFFAYSDTLRFGHIVSSLQIVEEKDPFIESFKKEYGIPLWDYAYCLDELDSNSYFVPLFNIEEGKQITAVWFFTEIESEIFYAPFCKGEKVDSDMLLIFDLLTYLVFGDDNVSGVVVRPHSQTRMWITVSTCWDVYTGTESTGLEYSYTNCIDKTMWVDEARSWSINPDTGGGGGILPGGGGGGSSSSGSSNAEHLFDCSDFSDNNIKLLNGMLEEIMDDCMGQELYNGLISELGNDKVSIRIVDNMDSNYSWKSGILTLNVNTLGSDVLFHELFHLFQTTQESVSSFESALLNREIECHYAQYMYKKRSQINWGYRDLRWYSLELLNDYLEQYMENHDEMMLDFINSYTEYTIVNVFRSVSGYNSYPLDKGCLGLDMFQNFNNLSKDCK